MRDDLFVGAKVKLKNGMIGVITRIETPLGFREFVIDVNGRNIKTTAHDLEELDDQIELSSNSSLESAMAEMTDFAEAQESKTQPHTYDRFLNIKEEEVDDFIEGEKAKKTKMKTEGHLRILNQFLNKRGESREVHNIEPQELNLIFANFFLSVRKVNGEEYQPTSLRDMMCSFNRHLRDKGYKNNVATDIFFEKARQSLSSKQKQLKKQGLGNKPKAAPCLSDQEKSRLYERKQIGLHSPMALLNTLWLNNTIYFGLRGTDEHRKLCWGDVQLKTDVDGSEFLEYNERDTKTRRGDDVSNVRAVKPRMWANKLALDQCPVQVYKTYMKLRPANYQHSESPFYIATNTKLTEADITPSPGTTWFKCQPIGVNKLATLMKIMSSKADLRPLTNHSARKHLVQKLNNAGIPPTHIMQITGHKSVKYKHLLVY